MYDLEFLKKSAPMLEELIELSIRIASGSDLFATMK